MFTNRPSSRHQNIPIRIEQDKIDLLFICLYRVRVNPLFTGQKFDEIHVDHKVIDERKIRRSVDYRPFRPTSRPLRKSALLSLFQRFARTTEDSFRAARRSKTVHR